MASLVTLSDSPIQSRSARRRPHDSTAAVHPQPQEPGPASTSPAGTGTGGAPGGPAGRWPAPAGTVATNPGSSRSPACIGEAPGTSCRYCAEKNSSPVSPNIVVAFASAHGAAPAGEQPQVDQRAAPAPGESPAAHDERVPSGGPDEQQRQRGRHAVGDELHRRAPAAPSSATSAPRRPGRALRPASGSPAAGPVRRSPAATVTGTFTANTEPHQKCSSSTPPTIGPSAAPAANPVAQTASAVRRRARSVNTVAAAPASRASASRRSTPSAARAATSWRVGRVGGRERDRPKPETPISSIRRRPIRSPSVPIVTSSPASTSG